MRTCPACGEDTEASYSEACTECGFSPMGEQEAEEPPAPAPEARVGDQETPPPEATVSDQPPPPETPPRAPPPEAPQEQKKRSPARWLLWLVIIAGSFGLYQLGVFDEPTGPDAEQVEESIADSAPAGVTVDCPDDAEDTPVGGTFTCTATGRNGRTAEIVVTNHEDTFEWDSGPLSTLG